MLSYTMIGTNDLRAAEIFYNALLVPLDTKWSDGKVSCVTRFLALRIARMAQGRFT